MTDKIPIGQYKKLWIGQKKYNFLHIKLKDEKNIKDGDIITLDMIEPYESEAVRKVTKYIYENLYKENDTIPYKKHAKNIIELVHEAEDADE